MKFKIGDYVRGVIGNHPSVDEVQAGVVASMDDDWLYLDTGYCILKSRAMRRLDESETGRTAGQANTPRGTVLAEAAELIHGERNKNYGSPTENFERIAAFWNVQLDNKLKPGEVITAGDVADLMIAVKLARSVNQPKRDNYVDIAGYSACGWECREAE